MSNLLSYDEYESDVKSKYGSNVTKQMLMSEGRCHWIIWSSDPELNIFACVLSESNDLYDAMRLASLRSTCSGMEDMVLSPYMY